MSDPQLLRLREEYRRVEKRKHEIEVSIVDLENRLLLINACIVSLERDERPADSTLETLNIRAKSSLALFYKASGLRKQTEALVVERRAEVQTLMSKLESLTVCPRCSGLGTLSAATRYERMQEEGMIIPVSSTSNCDFCNGSGKVVLADKGT